MAGDGLGIEPGRDAFTHRLAGEIEDTVGAIKAAGIEAGPMIAGGAFDPGGVGLLRRKISGRLRADNSKHGNAEACRNVPGAGIVADETIGGAKGVDEHVEIPVRFVDYAYAPILCAELLCEHRESFTGPAAHGLSCAGVDDDVATVRWLADLWRELPTKVSRELSPRGNPVGIFGAGQGLIEQKP